MKVIRNSLGKRSTFSMGILLCALSTLLTPLPAQEGEGDDNYILTAGDVIAVQVFGQNDLETVQEISNKGSINMGLIGGIQIARMTLADAEEKIRKAYMEQQYLRNPQVIIGVREYSPKIVSVLGQVNGPGSVQLDKDANSMPLARVISMVGGFRGIAKKDAIRVVRKTASGKEETLTVDMSDIGKSRSQSDDIGFMVYPDDVIYVPERIF